MLFDDVVFYEFPQSSKSRAKEKKATKAGLTKNRTVS